MAKLLRATYTPDAEDKESLERWIHDVVDNLFKIRRFTATIDPPGIGSDTQNETEYTVTGIKSTDIIIGIQHPDLNDGYNLVDYRVAANDSITLVFENETAGTLNPVSGSWEIVVIRTEA